MSEELRRTPLYARHQAAGARLVPFAGYAMPVQYDGIVAEHKAVRERAGLFDVSHMGEIRLRGPQAIELAQRLLTNSVADMPVGRVRYGLFCAEDGGVIDDVTAYRCGPEDLFFCVNASNHAADLNWVQKIHAAGGFDCEVIDESDATALLALQGPRALEIAQRVVAGDEPPPKRWRFRSAQIGEAEVLLSRTGYTGEDGYEIYAPAQAATTIWDALVEAGGAELCLAGLGARDTLRTEMAYPLYGHELDREHSPLEAGLERFVAVGQDFIGASALERQRESGVPTRLVGLLVEGRGIPRSGFPILAGDTSGVVTSGTYSPSIERAIAIGYVPAEALDRQVPLAIEIRGRAIPCQITNTPFYRRP